MEQITHRQCTFVLLAELPNKEIHQVIIKQEAIKDFISNYGEFKLLEKAEDCMSFEPINK